MAAQVPGPGTSLNVKVENASTGAVVRCSGVITAATMGSLTDQVHPLVGSAKHVMLDLGQVSYIDSSGLGAIVRLWSTGQKCNCALKISNVAPRIKDLLALTNLEFLFEK